MWLEWLRSPSRAHTSLRRPAEPPSPRYFSCSSFKDINAILLEEQNGSKSQPQTPIRPSIFHRVRIASPLHRNHSKTFIISPWLNYECFRVVAVVAVEWGGAVENGGSSGDEQEKYLALLGDLSHSTVSKKVRLPAVFLGGKYVGGAEEIKEMNESGELSKLIGGLPFVGNNIKIKFNSVCDVCGGLRYVLCAQ
ncbi:hypothetical protein MANES_11G152174v8 [Manihot esculenta]|uniref:Uncharacterized protein n=1 Tax=Manihot esculenta TaxID=3983 RepID=A0ACB7H157_MANES|nr:hypothetical protein MANES_11G152174v8 [Manihot esculenta]